MPEPSKKVVELNNGSLEEEYRVGFIFQDLRKLKDNQPEAFVELCDLCHGLRKEVSAQAAKVLLEHQFIDPGDEEGKPYDDVTDVVVSGTTKQKKKWDLRNPVKEE